MKLRAAMSLLRLLISEITARSARPAWRHEPMLGTEAMNISMGPEATVSFQAGQNSGADSVERVRRIAKSAPRGGPLVRAQH